MPIQFQIDQPRRLILERWQGVVSTHDLATFWRAYLANPEVLALRRTLVDLREGTIDFTGSELGHLVATIVRPALAGRDWTTAIVVSGEAQFGVSRQYQFFAESYSRDAIFDDYDEALAWIERQ